MDVHQLVEEVTGTVGTGPAGAVSPRPQPGGWFSSGEGDVGFSRLNGPALADSESALSQLLLEGGGRQAGDDRHWYHGAWPLLRALGLVSNPYWHDSFYTDAISAYAARHPGRLNVLIPATADAAIVEHVRSALGPFKATRVNLDVLDLSEVPLRLVSESVKRTDPGYELNTRVADARTLTGEGIAHDWYDLIVTDAFLTRFQAADKGVVVNEWSKVLKHGGQVITTCRLGGNPAVSADHDEIRAFADRGVAAYLRLAGLEPGLRQMVGPEEVRALAEDYAGRMTSNPINSEELTRLFHANGFRFVGPQDRFRRAWTAGEYEPTEYARIIAEKKGVV